MAKSSHEEYYKQLEGFKITDFFNVEFHKNYGEGTKFDLDYGKLLIIGLCIYIAIKVS